MKLSGMNIFSLMATFRVEEAKFCLTRVLLHTYVLFCRRVQQIHAQIPVVVGTCASDTRDALVCHSHAPLLLLVQVFGLFAQDGLRQRAVVVTR